MRQGGLLKADFDSTLCPAWSVKWPSGQAVSYEELVASVEHADPSGEGDLGLHAGVVIGKLPDLSYEVIWEAQAKTKGDLLSLAEELINAKDLLRFKEVLVTPEESGDKYKRFLRDVDGLTQYQILGQEDPDNPLTIKWAHEKEIWPYFHNRETIAGLTNVPLIIVTEFPSRVNFVRQLWNAGRFRIDQRQCPMSVVVMQLSYEDLVVSPLARAIIQGVATLAHWDYAGADTGPENEPWYGNRGVEK